MSSTKRGSIVQIVLLFPAYERETGLLLAAGPDSMRVVLSGRKEALELKRSGVEWVSESGERIEIEAIIADGREPAMPPEPPKARCASACN